jgi:hypothetical protein
MTLPAHVLAEFETQREALRIQSQLFATHSIRASVLQNRDVWTVSYHPKPSGPTITEARAIAQAYRMALNPIQIPEKS